MKRSSSDVSDEACEIKDPSTTLVNDGTDKSKGLSLVTKRLKSSHFINKSTDDPSQLDVQRQISRLRLGGVTEEEIALLRGRWRDVNPAAPLGQSPTQWERHAFGSTATPTTTRDVLPVSSASNGILPVSNGVLDSINHPYVVRRSSMLENRIG